MSSGCEMAWPQSMKVLLDENASSAMCRSKFCYALVVSAAIFVLCVQFANGQVVRAEDLVRGWDSCFGNADLLCANSRAVSDSGHALLRFELNNASTLFDKKALSGLNRLLKVSPGWVVRVVATLDVPEYPKFIRRDRNPAWPSAKPMKPSEVYWIFPQEGKVCVYAQLKNRRVVFDSSEFVALSNVSPVAKGDSIGCSVYDFLPGLPWLYTISVWCAGESRSFLVWGLYEYAAEPRSAIDLPWIYDVSRAMRRAMKRGSHSSR